MRLARPEASDEDIERALRRARDLGLDPRAAGWAGHARRASWGRSSPAVSGSGSRSRARCSPTRPVLVLDEPTAHLDPPMAQKLIRDVFAAAGDTSVLLITHRREGIDLVDEVLVLADGRIAPTPAPD